MTMDQKDMNELETRSAAGIIVRRGGMTGFLVGFLLIPAAAVILAGIRFALAAATGTAKTPKAVECEASQSGPNDSEGNAHA